MNQVGIAVSKSGKIDFIEEHMIGLWYVAIICDKYGYTKKHYEYIGAAYDREAAVYVYERRTKKDYRKYLNRLHK